MLGIFPLYFREGLPLHLSGIPHVSDRAPYVLSGQTTSKAPRKRVNIGLRTVGWAAESIFGEKACATVTGCPERAPAAPIDRRKASRAPSLQP